MSRHDGMAAWTPARIWSSALVSALLVLVPPGPVRATFSIVAVDTLTGAVGSAGASCIGGSQIIERLVENVGAMNTQALYNSQNQARGDSMMRAGDAPATIISYLVANDAQNDGFTQADRQYGAVTLAGAGASAAHTGTNNGYWAGARTGPGYSIQGNILLDSTIVYLMEAAFLGTAGPLDERLMAALEAAKVVGADSRCFAFNKSSISAFIKVIRPGDGGTPYLYEVVANTPVTVEPLDVLRDQYDAWKAKQLADPDLSTVAVAPGALPNTGKDTATITVIPLNASGLSPSEGAQVSLANSGSGTLLAVTDHLDGTFSASLVSGTSLQTDTVRATVDAGGRLVELTTRALVIYFHCGDANEDGVINAADIIYMVNHVFKSGPAPKPASAAGDVNRSGTVTAADIIYLVGFVFKSGPVPCP